MKQYIVLLGVLFLMSSCAWFSSTPKQSPEEKAKAEAQAAHKKLLAETETYVGDGIEAYGKGNDSLAIRSWKIALKLNPEDAEVHNFLGMSLHRQGKIKQALHEFEAALTINPAYYQAYNNAGYMWFLLNNYDRAKAAYDLALKYKPDFKPAQKNKALLDKVVEGKLSKQVFELSESASKIEDEDAQIAAYKKVILLDSTYAKAYNNLAVAYYYTGNLDSALIYLEKAVKLKKDYPEAINNLGYLYKVAGKYETAVQLFLRALTLKPKYVAALNNLAETYYLNNEIHNAQRTLNTVLELDPENSIAKRWLKLVEEKK